MPPPKNPLHIMPFPAEPLRELGAHLIAAASDAGTQGHRQVGWIAVRPGQLSNRPSQDPRQSSAPAGMNRHQLPAKWIDDQNRQAVSRLDDPKEPGPGENQSVAFRMVDVGRSTSQDMVGMDLSELNRPGWRQPQQIQKRSLVHSLSFNTLQSAGLVGLPGGEGVNQARNLFELAEPEKRDRANPLLVEHIEWARLTWGNGGRSGSGHRRG